MDQDGVVGLEGELPVFGVVVVGELVVARAFVGEDLRVENVGVDADGACSETGCATVCDVSPWYAVGVEAVGFESDD